MAAIRHEARGAAREPDGGTPGRPVISCASWGEAFRAIRSAAGCSPVPFAALRHPAAPSCSRSEEHTSELQSLMRISYAVFCLKKKKNTKTNYITQQRSR